MPIRQLRFIMFGLITTLIVSYGVTSARSSSFNVPASSGLPLVIGARFDHVGAMTNATHSNSVANPQGQNIASEIESNNLPISATLLLTGSVIEGNIFPAADVDYFQLSATAGDRVYAATMTSFSPSSSDTVLDVLATNGTTVVESDDEDGSFSSSSSSIAGTVITTTGSYYLRVRGFNATNLVFPYRLYLKLQSGTPTAETEPNNNGAPQPLPPTGWVTGTINPAVDTDTFSLALNAGDSVFLSLDADPERDGGITWNPRLGIGLFGNIFLAVDDENITSPNSEAQFMTVKTSGVYTVYVVTNVAGAGGSNQTYNLSVAVLPVQVQANCTTYTSTDAPKTLGPGTSVSRSTLTIPANVRIDDLDVTIVLSHTAMADLDVTLSAPSGVTSNTVGLFTDIGASTSIFMNVTLDDEAAIPAGLYPINNGTVFQPERDYRLGWFDGQNAAGTWTLALYDDTANTAGGILQGWSMRVCGTPPPTSNCPAGTIPRQIYNNNFEANDGGFTHSGTQDEWAWGAPTAAPINTSYSGTKSWKTDLTGTYNATSSQDLLSPAFDLTPSAYSGMAVYVSWAQKYQIESTQFDHAWVDVQTPGGSNARRLWSWFGPTMTTAVGDPSMTVQESGLGRVYPRHQRVCWSNGAATFSPR